MSQDKQCRVCGEVKPLSGFYRHSRTHDGHRSECRICTRKRTRSYYETHREATAETKRRYQAKARAAVLDHYGRSCACCGATENLSIDHVNGNGHEHRRELFGGSQGRASSGFYHWLVTQGFPVGYQTLCRSCNCSKGRGKRCILNHAEE